MNYIYVPIDSLPDLGTPTGEEVLPVSDGSAAKKVTIDTLAHMAAGALDMDTEPTAGSTNAVSSGGVKTALDTKQDKLTFDSAPTAGSKNPVTSGGVYIALALLRSALAGKQDKLDIDEVVRPNGIALVTSRGIYAAIHAAAYELETALAALEARVEALEQGGGGGGGGGGEDSSTFGSAVFGTGKFH